MLRPEITAEALHGRQADCLPGRFGLVVTRIAEGALDAELELVPWMMAPNGFLHAASVILLADTAAGYASIAHLPDGAKNFTTIELKTNFLGTAREGTIRTECRPSISAGRRRSGRRPCSVRDDRRLALFAAPR